VEEYTDEETPEVSAEEAAPAAGDDSAMRKLKQENQSLRQRLRRTELEANFGKDVVEMIPEELPLSKWEEFAGKLAERLPKAQNQTEQNEPAAEEPAQEAAPAGLAAVSGASTSGAPLEPELLTRAEIKELYKSDPVKAGQLVSQGKFQPAAPL
jgi:16S rRNA C967 or C1407 C5-methylase (RsmB/RsmF family)